jgi:hypothetical protein
VKNTEAEYSAKLGQKFFLIEIERWINAVATSDYYRH